MGGRILSLSYANVLEAPSVLTLEDVRMDQNSGEASCIQATINTTWGREVQQPTQQCSR